MTGRRIPPGIIVSSLFLLLTYLFSPARESAGADAESVVEYVLSCRKPNGAFGPADQHYTDAAWNFPAVAALKLLGHEIDRPELILDNGLSSPGGHVGYGHWQFFHQHRIRQLLGRPLQAEHPRVRLVHQGFEVRYYGSPFGTDGDTFFKAGAHGHPDVDRRDVGGEEFGYYNLSSLHYLLAGLDASGRVPFNPDELIRFVRNRQAPNGGFVDLRTETGKPKGDEAHVAHTFQSLAILRMLGSGPPDPEECVRFIHQCQWPSGGFHRQPCPKIVPEENPSTSLLEAPAPEDAGDIYYTWAAVKGLALLDAKPGNDAACRAWIDRLQNRDGGFGDQSGWRSRLYSTFYAVDALATLTDGTPAEAIERKKYRRPTARPAPIPEGRFQIFQSLNKMPVVEADDLQGLHDRGFNLLAIKSGDFAVAESLRAAIREKKLPMDVVLCPEAYPHRARGFGGALLHHVCNPMLDPAWGPDQRSRWKAIDAAGSEGLSWRNYRQKVIAPLRSFNSIVYPEQDFEMEFAYAAYDSGSGGYEAFLAGFNWAPRDFVRVFPWRERFVGKLIPIADCDAHGDLEKWSPQLDHTRNLFIAEGPAYHDFLEAASHGRVVCVIRNQDPGEGAATFYGHPAAVAYVKERMAEWKWW